MICKFCGNENPDELQHCSICGKELRNTLLRSLVGINADMKAAPMNDYSLGGIPKKGFEDTGGGAASGPQVKTDNRKAEKESGNGGAVFGTVLAIITILGVAAYFLLFAENAPFAHLVAGL